MMVTGRLLWLCDFCFRFLSLLFVIDFSSHAHRAQDGEDTKDILRSFLVISCTPNA